MDLLEKDLLHKLQESGRVHSLELLRSDIRNYGNLKYELSKVEQEYAKGMLPFKEKIEWANEELEKIKSPGYSDGLGGHAETLDKKIIRLNQKKEIANQELRNFYQKNNYVYFNRKWVLMSRIAYVDDILSRLDECDKQFIIDLYVAPIGFKNFMIKFKINNEGNVYRKANNILKKVLI